MQGRVVRLPVHLHELMAKVTKVDLEYQSEHGRRAGNEKLAELVGISQEKLAMLSKVCLHLFTALLGHRSMENFIVSDLHACMLHFSTAAPICACCAIASMLPLN